MTITEPIPDVQYGRGNWSDYISNWREKDAEWLQERTILRYLNTTTRGQDWPTPRGGQVTYRGDIDKLEMWSALRSTWISALMLQYLTSGSGGTSVDTAAGVNLSHTGAAGKGVTFTPTQVTIDLPLVNGALTTTVNNVGVQTPTFKKALLTTNATELLSDTPLAVPAVRLTGTGTVLDATGKAVTVGALTATSLALGAGAITTTGTVGTGALTATSLTAPTLNVSGTGTINGVTFPGNYVQASTGYVAGAGYYRGDTSGPSGAGAAVMGYRNPAGGAISGPTISIDSSLIHVRGGQGVAWHNAAGTHTSWISPVIVSGSDPGAANYPDGTIWIIP